MISKGARRAKVNVDKTDVFFSSSGCDLRRGFGTGRHAPPLSSCLPSLPVSGGCRGPCHWELSRELPLMAPGFFMDHGVRDLKPAPPSP